MRTRKFLFINKTLHDGRLLTLEDTVGFFNLILELKLSGKEQYDLVSFMRAP
jgi:hypothetical protein